MFHKIWSSIFRPGASPDPEASIELTGHRTNKDAAALSAVALRRSRRQRGTFWFVWLLVLAVAGVALWILRPQLTPELGTVKRGTAISAVYGTVLVEPISQSLVKAQASGVVSSVKVKKGDLVKEGDVLAEITDSMADQQLVEAQNELKMAKSAADIGPPSKPTLDAKLKGMEQLKKLLDEGNIAQSEYDRSMAELKTLQDRLKSEQLTIDAAIQAAQQKVDVANELLTGRIVHSTQDGEVLDFYSQLGQVITKGESMFLIGSQASQIHAKVNEEDVGLLEVDMPAIVRLYSFPNQDLKAKIRQVLPGAVNQEYSVLLGLDNPPTGILNGMTGELNIITGRREDTLIIPSRAIRSGVTPSVLVVVDGIVQSRDIKTGYRSIESAEITSGLNEGDLIILSDLDLYTPGTRVKVVLPQ
jgi:RND family efflux transporter MFP subunit